MTSSTGTIDARGESCRSSGLQPRRNYVNVLSVLHDLGRVRSLEVEPYSPNLVEGKFSEVPRQFILNSSPIHCAFVICRLREGEGRRSLIRTSSERQGSQSRPLRVRPGRMGRRTLHMCAGTLRSC